MFLIKKYIQTISLSYIILRKLDSNSKTYKYIVWDKDKDGYIGRDEFLKFIEKRRSQN